MASIPRLQQKYQEQVRAALQEQFAFQNSHQIPRLEKVTINMGVGSAVGDKKHLDLAYEAMTEIAGQKPVFTLSRKSISNFRLREGMPIGCMTTLRRSRMYEFMDRLISVVLPRVRDFRGVNPNAFDGRGNYSMGLLEQLVFPELNPDKFTRPQGMNITVVTSATTNEHGRELLRALGMPFREAKPKGSAA
ncbi:50S ribosomal protein L5 [Roseimaritima multifibrata]|uniref:Large ribosomal subunit protein uL5 n=1 Tax=Roseimaritima multifibrata TaxID=1930274 RepID=A0A517MDI5_9BACT|nr:50S ribosomal protein L5 [Roseimaritima multifibrata]QDS92945.1 50S ribosomal protein L5 [Roseimaritima multifibrata]